MKRPITWDEVVMCAGLAVVGIIMVMILQTIGIIP